MTDFLNVDEQPTPQVTLIARDVTETSTNTSGAAFVQWLVATSKSAGFTGKTSYKMDGEIVSAERLNSEDFAGKTLVAEAYNSAA